MSKVAFITAIFGNYETLCQPYIKQTIDTDFICFTDNANIKSNSWIIDTHPYHETNPSPIDTGYYINSMCKHGWLKQFENKHSFNISKYYKQAWKNIPRLKEYDLVIWIDGTIEITSEEVSEYMIYLCNQKNYGIVSWHHEFRGGNLIWEVQASYLTRYHSRDYMGQTQPYQDVVRQYHEYIQDGFEDRYYLLKYNEREEGRGRGDHFGVWLTAFVAFNNKSEEVAKFLDIWYLQTLKYTTQDQVGFVKTVWDTKLIPYTLPDLKFKGDEPHKKTDVFIKQLHTNPWN